jgi:hypothetical protein
MRRPAGPGIEQLSRSGALLFEDRFDLSIRVSLLDFGKLSTPFQKFTKVLLPLTFPNRAPYSGRFSRSAKSFVRPLAGDHARCLIISACSFRIAAAVCHAGSSMRDSQITETEVIVRTLRALVLHVPQSPVPASIQETRRRTARLTFPKSHNPFPPNHRSVEGGCGFG